METTQEHMISVIEPISPAIQKTKEILFSPFNLSKWCAIGFCAFLAVLGEGGGGGNFNMGQNIDGGGGPQAAEVKAWLAANLYWLVPVAIAVIVFILVVSIVFCWLRSRGKFMFLHCVICNRGDIAWPWKTYAKQGNSLFLFRLALGAISFVCILPFIALLIFSIYLLAEAQVIAGGILLLIASITLLILGCLGFGIISKFTNDFIVPIMALRYCRVIQAWKEFIGLLKINKGKFALYLLFQIVIALVIGIISGTIAIVTCCLCCTLAIPLVGWYIAAVVFLPLSVFAQSYILLYLAQYGPQYDLFNAVATAQAAQISAMEMPAPENPESQNSEEQET